MEVKKNISLKDYNSFGIDAKASAFIEIQSVDALRKALQIQDFNNRLVLSGGSNMLITKDIDALVLYINIKGIKVLWEDEEQVCIKVMAGENWHSFVLWTLDKGYGGLENLSLIPGNCGTAPMQNIGAYGVELKEVFHSCEAMEISSLRLLTFSKDACAFGYRESFFKNEGKNKYIITSVTLILSKKNHQIRTSYGAIEEELKNQKVKHPTPRDISNAVIAIRSRKLPDPKELGNSGSFFKNPVVSKEVFDQFIAQFPEAPHYKVSAEEVKVPAGWLIEQCGYKGKRFGDAGVHKNQALVLVNYGNATGSEILNLAHKIQAEVWDTFGIKIHPEVNIID